MHSLGNDAPQLQLRSCPLTNISQCDITESSDNFIVSVYNPISRPKSHFVRLPVTGSTYTVRDPSGAEIPTQVVPIAAPLFDLPGRQSSATGELVFKVQDIPALGYRSYYVSKSNEEKVTTVRNDKDKVIENEVSIGQLYRAVSD